MPTAKEDGLENIRIAVVDDDPSVRQALRRLLQSIGCSAETFSSADDFLRSPSPEKFECLILDVQMPGLSGLELQKVIGSLRNPLPIIFITAHPDENLRRQALLNGAVGFLEKPFDDNALIELIHAAVKK
jgi:FixJ family two-component response regulator